MLVFLGVTFHSFKELFIVFVGGLANSYPFLDTFCMKFISFPMIKHMFFAIHGLKQDFCFILCFGSIKVSLHWAKNLFRKIIRVLCILWQSVFYSLCLASGVRVKSQFQTGLKPYFIHYVYNYIHTAIRNITFGC